MEQMHAYIGIRGAENSSQFADVPLEQMDLYQKHWWQPVHSEVRVPKTKWVVLRYPTASMAQAADMSTEAFEDFYFDVCTADYAQMAKDQEPLVRRMEAADQVRIVGPGTDLQFSIEGIPVRPCHGRAEHSRRRSLHRAGARQRQRRDPLQHAVALPGHGVRQTSSSSSRTARSCGPRANETEKLNAILDSDEGARYIGEWSIGCNNRVRQPMLDTLFDEKIGGSIHLTPGNAYDECDNGNRSRVHWDLVLIQTPEYGGGEIWFDGEMLRKDGRFVPADLAALNRGL